MVAPLAWFAKRAYRTFFRWQLLNSYSYLPVEGLSTLGCARFASSGQKARLIREVLEQQAGGRRGLSMLDVGCNNGYFALQLAKEGHFVLGIDPFEHAIEVAEFARVRARLANAAFVCARVDEEALLRLPRVDVALLLSVFQKWCAQYGFERSTAMLKILWAKTASCLFFECSDSLDSIEQFRVHLPDMGRTKEACRRFFERFLQSSLPACTVEYLGGLPLEYRAEERFLFVVRRMERPQASADGVSADAHDAGLAAQVSLRTMA